MKQANLTLEDKVLVGLGLLLLRYRRTAGHMYGPWPADQSIPAATWPEHRENEQLPGLHLAMPEM